MPKKLLVTGSTKGIGKAILERFHEDNWDVCISGRNNEDVVNLQNKLNMIRKDSAIGASADLSQEKDIKSLSNYIQNLWGNLDCIVFNVGSGSGSKGINSSFENNLSLLQINYTDVVKNFNFLSTLLAKNPNGGNIIFIGSISQDFNVKAPVAYSYSKRAINNFAKSQALVLASKNIKVIVVNPGHILTAGGVWWEKKQESPQDFDEFIAQNIPTGKIGKEENVAEMVFSCVNQNLDAFLTGQSLTIDGGTSLMQ